MNWKTMFFTVLILATNMFGQGQSAVIVKQVALTNQTAFISPTELLIPTSTALYRVSAYFEVLSFSRDGDEYFLNIGWTDATLTGNRKKTLTIRDYDPALYSNSASLIVSDLAGKPLEYSVTDNLGLQQPADPFDLYITVEQLQ
jgi:hypothetical protein